MRMTNASSTLESDFLFFYEDWSAAALIPMTIGEDYPPLNNKLIAFYLFPVITRITTGEKSYLKTIYLQWKKSKLISVRVMVLLQTLVKVYSCVWRLPRKFLRR